MVDRFLRHLLDSGCSPNTAVAYAYDLRYLFEFLGHEQPGVVVVAERLGGDRSHVHGGRMSDIPWETWALGGPGGWVRLG